MYRGPPKWCANWSGCFYFNCLQVPFISAIRFHGIEDGWITNKETLIDDATKPPLCESFRQRRNCNQSVLCLQHGLVPETFLHGVLIPIYKTGKDSSKANSYRPVTLSVTLTKILEMYILDTCSVHHQPHPAQFGFTSHRGTDMAIAVAHDVSQYYNSRGSSCMHVHM